MGGAAAALWFKFSPLWPLVDDPPHPTKVRQQGCQWLCPTANTTSTTSVVYLGQELKTNTGMQLTGKDQASPRTWEGTPQCRTKGQAGFPYAGNLSRITVSPFSCYLHGVGSTRPLRWHLKPHAHTAAPPHSSITPPGTKESAGVGGGSVQAAS